MFLFWGLDITIRHPNLIRLYLIKVMVMENYIKKIFSINWTLPYGNFFKFLLWIKQGNSFLISYQTCPGTIDLSWQSDHEELQALNATWVVVDTFKEEKWYLTRKSYGDLLAENQLSAKLIQHFCFSSWINVLYSQIFKN